MHKLTRGFGPALDKIEQLKKGNRIKLTHRGSLNGKAANLIKSKTKGFEIHVNGIIKGSIDVGDELKFGTILPQKNKINAFCKSINTNTSRRIMSTHIFRVWTL